MHIPFLTLVLMISFASVNAVLFTPALPDIAKYFSITEDTAQLTITWFLVGYAFGQLLYGPIANRFGRKPALYSGIILQILSSLLCVIAGKLHLFSWLIVGRFMLALGAGVGLKMTFTLLNECYSPKAASQKLSYLMLAFAITPGLGIALGGFLTQHFGWMSCFYAGMIYGFILLLLITRIPETQTKLDLHALEWKHLFSTYAQQIKNSTLIAGSFLMGANTSFIYVFAALGPFLAIDLSGMNSSEYGLASLLPPLGMIIGSLLSGILIKQLSMLTMIRIGIACIVTGTLCMIIAMWLHLSVLLTLFAPLVITYFGGCFLLANASSIAMSRVADKAHGAAVMSFLNMGLATVVVLSLGFFHIQMSLLPTIYISLCIFMILLYQFFLSSYQEEVIA